MKTKTVKELREFLAGCPDSAKVVINENRNEYVAMLRSATLETGADCPYDKGNYRQLQGQILEEDIVVYLHS